MFLDRDTVYLKYIVFDIGFNTPCSKMSTESFILTSDINLDRKRQRYANFQFYQDFQKILLPIKYK